MKDCIVYENYLIYMNRINLWFKIFGYILMDLLKIKQPMFYDLVLTSIMQSSLSDDTGWIISACAMVLSTVYFFKNLNIEHVEN